MLHGEEGKGRLRALGLGRVAEWKFTAFTEQDDLVTFRILLIKDEPRRVRISPALPAKKGSTQGVEVRISELHKQIRLNADNDNLGQELAEVYALYLSAYPDVTISDLGLISPACDVQAISWRRAQKRQIKPKLTQPDEEVLKSRCQAWL